jgi:hypothetical protein
MHDVPAAMQLPRDPKDEPYLNLAIATKASFIVTRDNDMLSLMKDDEFRKAYPTLAIVDPDAFLSQVRAASAAEEGSSDASRAAFAGSRSSVFAAAARPGAHTAVTDRTTLLSDAGSRPR